MKKIYSRKTTSLIYECKSKRKPKHKKLFDDEKANLLIEEINKSDIDEADKKFLINAAKRHIIFNYEQIAEFYAWSNKDVQELMEKSGLVIIDFDQAIKNGFLKLTEEAERIFRGGLSDD